MLLLQALPLAFALFVLGAAPQCPPCPAGAPPTVTTGAGPCQLTITITPFDGTCVDPPNCVPGMPGCIYQMRANGPIAGCCPAVAVSDGVNWLIWVSGAVENVRGPACSPNGVNTLTLRAYSTAGAACDPFTATPGPAFNLSCGSCN